MSTSIFPTLRNGGSAGFSLAYEPTFRLPPRYCLMEYQRHVPRQFHFRVVLYLIWRQLKTNVPPYQDGKSKAAFPAFTKAQGMLF